MNINVSDLLFGEAAGAPSASRPITVLRPVMQPRAWEHFEQWAADKGITRLEDLAADPGILGVQMGDLNALPGIGPITLTQIEAIWWRDHIRLAINRTEAARRGQPPLRSTVAAGGLTAVAGLAALPFGLPYAVLSGLGLGYAFWEGRHTLEHEHFGILELLEGRLKCNILLNEGTHPLLPGVVGTEDVFMGIQTIALPMMEAWSSDETPIVIKGKVNDELVAAAILQVQVFDPILWTSVNQEQVKTEALPARALEVTRTVAREYDAQEVRSGQSVEAAISDAIEVGVNRHAVYDWGLRVVDNGVHVPMVDVDAEVRRAIEKAREDDQYLGAMDKVVADLIGKGVKPEQAVRRFQLHRGEITETIEEHAHRWGLDEKTLESIATPIIERLIRRLTTGDDNA